MYFCILIMVLTDELAYVLRHYIYLFANISHAQGPLVYSWLVNTQQSNLSTYTHSSESNIFLNLKTRSITFLIQYFYTMPTCLLMPKTHLYTVLLYQEHPLSVAVCTNIVEYNYKNNHFSTPTLTKPFFSLTHAGARPTCV
jgi:hypothetical protein